MCNRKLTVPRPIDHKIVMREVGNLLTGCQ